MRTRPPGGEGSNLQGVIWRARAVKMSCKCLFFGSQLGVNTRSFFTGSTVAGQEREEVACRGMRLHKYSPCIVGRALHYGGGGLFIMTQALACLRNTCKSSTGNMSRLLLHQNVALFVLMFGNVAVYVTVSSALTSKYYRANACKNILSDSCLLSLVHAWLRGRADARQRQNHDTT